MEPRSDEFTDIIFSWSLDDILNQDLYKTQVEKIPCTFDSEQHYLSSFVYPLLEETRAELACCMEIMYRYPSADILSIHETRRDEKIVYDTKVGPWRNRFSERGKQPYQTLPGDLLILMDGKAKSVSDLQQAGRSWALSLVNKISENDSEDEFVSTPSRFTIKASRPLKFQDGMFVVFLKNITSPIRIWNSLHINRNLSIIKVVLNPDSMVKEICSTCSFDFDALHSQNPNLFDKLNESQREAVMASLHKTECSHNSCVEQIWGPPGTGKTTTVSILLFVLLQMNRRTLTCAPTNIALLQLASCVLSLVRKSFKRTISSGHSFCSFGDVLLFGNKERLKIGAEMEEIYLEHRVERLIECFGPLTGWKHCIGSMNDLLENCVSQYHIFVENELWKEKQLANGNQSNTKTNKLQVKSFLEFLQDRFRSSVMPLRRCILTFLTHVPRSFMKEYNFHSMIYLLDNLSSFELLLFQENLVSQELEHLFTSKPFPNQLEDMSSINSIRAMSILVLRGLLISLEVLGLPYIIKRQKIEDFCFERASLIFCTTSSSYKLHMVPMKPLNILVIDEAAQLKEADSTIPLQLPGMKHAILIGDECQLPAVLTSNVCIESGFGRSLFERLSSLGHYRHLLNVQYRMSPSISFFPNWRFYQNQILDAENVLCESYEKQYLLGPMFGPYSFINVVEGIEEKDDDGRSKRNMVEVAIVIKIVQNLHRAWKDLNKKLTIGIVSPYAAQVVMIQEKLGHKYEKLDGFSIKVKSIDEFQGGEEDVIILSTVRSNRRGSVGFMSSPQRTNVALTRARHCLWILGHERTLTNSESIWKDLVYDARNRHCLFDADSDECLKTAIINTKKELAQLDDLFKETSVLFKHAKWKVLFSDNFRKSFRKLTSARLKKLVLNLLLRLAGGWRPKNQSVDFHCEKSSHILRQFKVAGLYVICTIDIIKESSYVQVLKVWDVLPFEEIPKLTKRLESIFAAYTDDYISRCTTKCMDGNLEVPKSWLSYKEIIKFRYNNETGREMRENPCDGISYVENSKVNESLLLMKFYSLSDVVVKHLLSDNELVLPMQVSDEQMDIILFSRSSFIIGRSGTGKTTILTMKLFQNEQSFRAVSEAIYEADSSSIGDSKAVEDSEDRKPLVLRQLFVTVSPKLCHVVKQHVSHLTSISCNESLSTEIYLNDDEVTSEFKIIPDTFTNIPVKDYPLVITFHKFLLMLDGTLGNSFFGRFLKKREDFHLNLLGSRSVALQTFIRLREVTFDRFCSLYWPHFDSSLTKKLDPSRVFTEIISHIKGGLQAGECSDGKLNFEGYSLLAECRSSILTKQKRNTVYNLFQAYEKMKTERGEFDLGDLVNDLHHRLKSGHYEGDKMDFVYIDEVQDLSMRQISLFKYICQNVDEGFLFAGDTAQTIARGIDFRFQDIRSLFYKEFLPTRITGKQGKGLVTEIFQLKQNFRTHSGVLDLAQSVIDIIYHYFVHSIDVLEPETSQICGETPVLLESADDENAIATIFGGNGNGGKIVGFGAEQVILVRDDCAKIEICEYVGKHALVLTIVECKGLEFQDVLLYNFFGTSPLKDQWRVIYGYMKERDWIDESLPQSFPRFSEARHSLLCSELKQLYVAITRTKQRLWVCESIEELSKPMFEYWKRRGLVQTRKIDDSVAQAMGVASSPQEWRERGKKLLYDNNFVMATMCFEKSGDTMLEKLAKASGLRASADQMRGKKPEAYLGHLREAAEMFESIGKLESAASCYCDVGDYEIAGKIYLYKCEKIDAAAECFILAGCYSEAAEAYAKGDQFSNCLSVCKKGKLFDKGMQYIEYWKEHVDVKSKELEQLEQEFLESCALHYHKHKDLEFMMKFVRAFFTVESKRVFLRSLGCNDELLLLEEEWGQFVNAAELARSLGYVLKEADLLEKAGDFMEAADLLLWYILFSSLWGKGNRGWPLKQFAMKEDLCEKARSVAKMTSDKFYDFVCNELKVLSDKHSSLPELKKNLLASQKYKSLRGEILSIRKILDSHFHINFSKYFWEDELPSDITKHCENQIFQSCVSVRTLVFYWNQWKENVMNIFQSIKCLENEQPNISDGLVDFSISYFGVRKHCVNGNMVYMLVNKDGDWIRNTGNVGLHKEGKFLIMNTNQLVLAMTSYWQSELLSVGIKVLEKLEGLHKSKSNGSTFHQSTSLLHIFEVSKFLLDCQCVNLTFHYKKKLQSFLGISAHYFDLVFPLDWRRSVSEDLVSLRKTDISLHLFDEIILQNVDINGDITYWTIGMVMMLWFSSRKPAALNEKIVAGVQWSLGWRSLVELWNVGYIGICVVPLLRVALGDTFSENWSNPGYISPHSFVHLLDRLLFMESFSSGLLFTTKTSFVGWFTELHPSDTALSALKQIYIKTDFTFFVSIVQRILYNKEDTESWIRRSKINVSYYHPLLALKLVMMLSLISLQVSDFYQVLLDLLTGKNNIEYLLPKKFVFNLLRNRKGDHLHLSPQIVAEAFTSIEDPLLIVSSESKNPQIDAPCAIFVDLRKSKEDIMNIVFTKKAMPCSQSPLCNDGCGITPEAVLEKSSDNQSGGGNTHHVNNRKAKKSSKGKKVKKNTDISQTSSKNECEREKQTGWKLLEEMSEVVTGKNISKSLSSSSVAAMVKEVDESMDTFLNTFAGQDTTYVLAALNQLDVIASAVASNMGGKTAEDLVFSKCIQGLRERLQSSSSSSGSGSGIGSGSGSPNGDGSSNHSVTIHEEAGSSSTSTIKEAGEEEEETDRSLVLEKPSSSGDAQDAKNNKVKVKKKKCKHRKCGCANQPDQPHPTFFRRRV